MRIDKIDRYRATGLLFELSETNGRLVPTCLRCHVTLTGEAEPCWAQLASMLTSHPVDKLARTIQVSVFSWGYAVKPKHLDALLKMDDVRKAISQLLLSLGYSVDDARDEIIREFLVNLREDLEQVAPGLCSKRAEACEFSIEADSEQIVLAVSVGSRH